MTLRCKIEPCQDLPELDAFIELVKRENINSYLEIGSRWGGSFWRVMTALPKGSHGVSVDLQPNMDLDECMNVLTGRGYSVTFISGDSTHPSVVEAVRQGAPYDLCLIDGDHTAYYVRSDWKNYGPMAKIVAFHDINYHRPYLSPTAKWPIDVPKLWKEIKGKYRHEEIKLCHTQRDNGFGILWR